MNERMSKQIGPMERVSKASSAEQTVIQANEQMDELVFQYFMRRFHSHSILCAPGLFPEAQVEEGMKKGARKQGSKEGVRKRQ